ncbi:flagellar assembly peptidoglycan hydrolase FlgJ [Pseudocolwellia sp. AS88]|uniref:flagellar assembly peptidoglycan hydrolase FlgJ n=1 Tax=Pseudocolwellia sp. AS88 TaxID=3063958 RepID=UPI0026EFB59C|nr:flagellar assembly peptidoglycan hydrolase FlgJ [Pseudocolwellia sp. AS88]MDO7085079.1 flagellar assembly peptidoglycan hydrolase FlgJ [Pseudocolwellia sp. AS88]
MTKITDAQNFLDVNGLNSVRQQSKSTDKAEKEAALQTAAKQFEAIFMQMLLKSMRSAQDVLESDSPFNSETSKSYRQMHDQQMSLELSNNGALGLSELIVRQLGGDSENFTPHSVLRNDGNLDARGKNVFDLQNIREPLAKTINEDRQTTDKNTIEVPKYLSKDNTLDSDKSIASNNNLQPEFTNPADFISAMTASAKQVEAKLNIPFEVVIAQAALETGWGQKIIKTNQGESSNNLFNIKADSRWQGDKTTTETLEFEQGTMIKKREPFRVYSSLAESVNDYVNFLSTSERYKPALEQTSNVEQFLHTLQDAGYATDPNYAKKIMGTLRTVSSLLNK